MYELAERWPGFWQPPRLPPSGRSLGETEFDSSHLCSTRRFKRLCVVSYMYVSRGSTITQDTISRLENYGTSEEVRIVVRHRPRYLGPVTPWSHRLVLAPGTTRRLIAVLRPVATARKVEKIRELDRAEAWGKEQAKREAREKNRLNKEENRRLILMKAAEWQVTCRYRRGRARAVTG